MRLALVSGMSFLVLGSLLLSSSLISAQVRNQPLKVALSINASPKLAQNLWPGRKAFTNYRGRLSLLFPFKAGVYQVFQCTDIALSYSYFQSGNTKVGITASQKWFCPRQYYTRFDIKRPSSLGTEYRIGSNGHFIVIKNVAWRGYSNSLGKIAQANGNISVPKELDSSPKVFSGVITGDSENTYFGSVDGNYKVFSNKGSSVVVSDQEAVKAENSSGALFIYVPTTTYSAEWISSSRVRLFSHPSNVLILNGKIVPQAVSLYIDSANILKVLTVTGKEQTYILRPQWPYSDKAREDKEAKGFYSP